MARSRSPYRQLSALSDQLSAVCSPERGALGRPAHAPRRETASRATEARGGNRRREASRHYTDSSGAFACRAATVASVVNPPERRPSASAATAEGPQGAAGRHGADGADAQALVVVMSGAFGSTGLGGE
jgi:hypothetical protein